MIRDPLALSVLIVAATALGFSLDRGVPLLSKVGASLLVIIFGAALSNLGLVARDSPVYHAVEGPVTSLAIVYLLLSVNLADLRETGPKLLLLFLVAALGTATGAFTGAFLFGGALGPETWKLAGTFTGTYTGGGLNFAAVGRGVGLDGSIFAAAAAADNVTTALWLGVTLAAPVWLLRGRQNPSGPASAVADGAHPFWSRTAVSLLDLASLAALGALILLASRMLGSAFGFFPEVLWLTTAALAIAQIPIVRRIRGAQQLGNLGLHFFFVVIGIRSVLSEILRVGPEVFYYTAWVVAVHGLILYVVGRALGGSVPMIAVASQAAIGGPSTAMAVSVARGWPALMLPGVAIGLLGYALGNYTGFGIAHLVRVLMGG